MFIDYLQTHIFAPAGMKNTRDDNPFALISYRSRGYSMGPNGVLLNSPYVDMSNKTPAGEIISPDARGSNRICDGANEQKAR